MTRSQQGFIEELLGCSHVSLSGKPKIDCGVAGVDGMIEAPTAATLANVHFVDPPGPVSWSQFPPGISIALHPSPSSGVVSKETSFHEQLLDLPIRKGEP
jgi:hypothetical protein